MYTQNGNPDRNLEAVVLRVVWPDWLAELERTRYDNPLFVPITFDDFTAGYDTNSAVLFPETVAVREAPERSPGAGSSATARRPASAGHRGRRRHARPATAAGRRAPARRPGRSRSRPSCCGT